MGSVGRDRPDLLDLFLFYGRHYHWLETAAHQMQHPTPIQGRWRIDGIALPRAVLTKVYRTNALKLLWPDGVDEEVDRRALEEAPGLAYYLD